MGERTAFENEPPRETREDIEAKKERLRPVFQQSLDVFQNPDRPLIEGALTVRRDNGGKMETFDRLVILAIEDDAVELGMIEEDGEIGPSAFMSWDEIIDAAKG